MSKLCFVLFVFVSCCSPEASAQCPSSSCSAGMSTALTPSFRGNPCSEFAGWLNICQATTANYPDEAASTTNDATLLQLDPNSIVTVSCNLYNFRAVQQFVISDRSPGDLQEVVLQTRAIGTPIDPLTYALYYSDAQSVLQRVAPTIIQTLANPEETMIRFDLSALHDVIESYELRFDALGTSCSLNHVQLDTLSTPRALCADRERLSRVRGGMQTLYLDAGAAHAGELYAILGSASGTTPGLYFGPGLELELAFDPYMIASLQLANSTYFLNTVNHLDALGRAQAAIAMPPTSVFVDINLHHGFVVFDAAGTIVATSNPQPLELRL